MPCDIRPDSSKSIYFECVSIGVSISMNEPRTYWDLVPSDDRVCAYAQSALFAR